MNRIDLIREIIIWLMFLVGSVLMIANTEWQVSLGIFLFITSEKLDIINRLRKKS